MKIDIITNYGVNCVKKLSQTLIIYKNFQREFISTCSSLR